MRFPLVPVCNGSNVIRQRLIGAVWPPSEGLYSDAKVTLEADWIHNVPAVQAPLGGTITFLIIFFKRVPRIGVRINFREAVAASEVVLLSLSRKW